MTAARMPSMSVDGALLAAIGDQGTTVWRIDAGTPSVVLEQSSCAILHLRAGWCPCRVQRPEQGNAVG